MQPVKVQYIVLKADISLLVLLWFVVASSKTSRFATCYNKPQQNQ